jgi:hypothetical protein
MTKEDQQQSNGSDERRKLSVVKCSSTKECNELQDNARSKNKRKTLITK